MTVIPDSGAHLIPSLMKNILVPTDFSVESHHAFAVALQLARHTDGGVTLLHVLEAPEAATANFSTYGSPVGDEGIDQLFTLKLLEATKHRMHALKNEAARLAAGVPVHDAVETGRIGEGILAAIERHGADLVVMGAQGHGAMEHFFVGSNTERLIRLAPCPVLTVKHAHPDFAVRTIVFPSDFAEEAAGAAEGLRRVQAAFPEATLHLLHVVANHDSQTARQHIQAFAARAGLQKVHPEVLVADSTATGIEHYARQVGADLVVLSTHARTGLSAFFRTSIAETVATHAFPPVLTYHLLPA